ncbi:AraC family transcriptional regulator ligand-binding domain-containing protein [Mycolicibacterium elephantis]|uniref:AraC family transcriptional regulator n=1 Tax=Mycolicibacterium elephantis TaxID=81858 RepID=UPI0007EA7D67|nr:AraC family transcriptional regulator [Mycolicibacterium elephantis]OBB16351.1 hypothetical protein A5762_03645 [Mycolicibacterium elephantis]OBE95295.1 hypothetical protein A5776_02085 [Mycolicibacterium elephantis]
MKSGTEVGGTMGGVNVHCRAPRHPLTSRRAKLRLAHSAEQASGPPARSGALRAQVTNAAHPSNDVKYLISQHHVMEFAQLARRQGWELVPLLRSAGILRTSHKPRCLGVSKRGLAKLMRAMWRLTDDEMLNLGSAPVPIGTFRLLAYALGSAPNLGAALNRLQQCKEAVPGIPGFSVTNDGGVTTLCIQTRISSGIPEIVTDSLVAVAHRTINWGIGLPLPLLEVRLPRVAPQVAEEYESLFGAPVRFAADSAALVFASEALSYPLGRTPADIDEFLDDAPLGLMTDCDQPPSHSARVRLLMKARIGCDASITDNIATELGVSRQTLHRRLQAENTSLLDIKNEVLRDAAIESLQCGEETIAALSRRLGFSEPAAFSRAFRRWTGVPPSVYRSRHGSSSPTVKPVRSSRLVASG